MTTHVTCGQRGMVRVLPSISVNWKNTRVDKMRRKKLKFRWTHINIVDSRLWRTSLVSWLFPFFIYLFAGVFTHTNTQRCLPFRKSITVIRFTQANWLCSGILSHLTDGGSLADEFSSETHFIFGMTSDRLYCGLSHNVPHGSTILSYHFGFISISFSHFLFAQNIIV